MAECSLPALSPYTTLFWTTFFLRAVKTLDCIVKGYPLTPSQTSPGFYVCAVKPFKNTVGKGEIACNKQFLLFPQCFLPFWRGFCYLHQLCNYCQQTLSVWTGLKYVVWERFNNMKSFYTNSYRMHLLRKLYIGTHGCYSRIISFKTLTDGFDHGIKEKV